MNTTHEWYIGSIMFSCRVSLIMTASLYAPTSFSNELLQQSFIVAITVFMHLKFSMNDEAGTRESFFDDVTISSLKNSLPETLDTLPEPLAVSQEQQVVYSNKAFAEVTKLQEESKEAITAITSEKL